MTLITGVPGRWGSNCPMDIRENVRLRTDPDPGEDTLLCVSRTILSAV